ELYNYELRAPGYQIMSTFPGGRYKNLNGTSMACPLAAGAISRLIQCKEILSQELLFGDLIHMRKGNIDMLATYNITDADRRPELALVTANLQDTASGDGDLRADAGETIECYPIFKNAWGQAENVRFWIKTGYYNQGDWVWDDTTLIHSLQDTAYFGKPLSSYAKATSRNPYRMTISPDCADGRKINMTFFAICDNAADTLRQTITLDVENGVEIGGMISEDLTLYPNVHYIVTSNLAIPEGVKLTIKPGTILKFRAGTGISVKQPQKTSKACMINGKNVTVSYPDTTTGGRIIARGTKDSLIIFSFDPSAGNSNEINIQTNLFVPSAGGYYYDTLINFVDYWEYVKIEMGTARGQIYNTFLKDCIIENLDGVGNNHYGFGVHAYQMVRCQYINCSNTRFSDLSSSNHYTHIYSNFANINRNDFIYAKTTANINLFRNCNIYPIMHNNVNGERYVLASTTGTPELLSVPSSVFWGTGNLNVLKKYVYDIDKNYYYGKYDLSNIRTTPIREAHGIVWKILVDGIDAQDEFEQLPPIGVGQHECKVYFNRPMDVSIAPNISFGVRQPYTQHQVAENGSWSADSTIYTAYFTIDGKSVTDGLNTLKVYGAEDPDHFPIAEENFRFNMEVAATGSMSTGLMAEAGLGKVTLTWETDEEDFADLLGYNIYRWTGDTVRWNSHYENGKYIPAGWRIDTICVNSSLIDSQDTEFVDYNVVPGKDYYYVIRQVTTSLNSYDLSNAVVARPLTAIKGDANGSMTVDVADVITEVNYITRQNPQPFIFEAADVNSDDQVNIIDVVATVDLILHPQAGSQAIQENTAYYYIENGILYVESDVVLGGVQCTFAAEKGHPFATLDALKGFETVGTWQNEEQYMFMAYSMSGKTLGVGKTALLQIGDAELTDIIFSDAQGRNVAAAPKISTALDGTTFVPAASKYLQEGALYIKHGKHIYNVMGTLIK
ncbi:MAG: S8 family serine peptidase, partial [Paludibacteraceae bacterium]|nr:S8 family serine peptidase [Paludibacteraceae bacterium]